MGSRVSKFFTVVLLLFTGLNTWALEMPVKVYLLKGQDKYCTATLMKWYECRLVTNAHCVQDINQKLSLVPYNQAQIPSKIIDAYGKISQSLDVTVEKIQRDKDLAQLSVPESLKNNECLSLPLVNSTMSERVESESRIKIYTSFSTIGFHHQIPTSFFTQNLDWSYGWGLEYLRRVPSGLKGLLSMFKLEQTGLQYGMSGGPVIDQNFDLVGLNTRFVPFQDEIYIIPISDVLSFLASDKIYNDDPLTFPNRSNRAGDNVGGHGGDNVGGHGGDNVGGHGGDNVGGHGGDSNTYESGLSFIKEPQEGIFVTDQGKLRRLLALGDNQVDGQDDLAQYSPLKLTPLYEDSEEFKKAQSKIIKRLSGDYRTTLTKPQVKIVFLKKIDGDEWQSYLRGQAVSMFSIKKVGSKGIQISIKVPEFSVYKKDDFSRDRSFIDRSLGKFGEQEYTFKGEISQNYQTITLQSGTGNYLICKNDNYLKLICSSNNSDIHEELSFSFSRLNNPEVKLRYSRFAKVKGSDLQAIQYIYGTFERY